jgi:hypothetical protein
MANPIFAERAQDLQNQRWQTQDQDRQQSLAPLSQALQAQRTRLALYADPNDPTKPLAGKEQEYSAAHDATADIIGKMRMILHPPPPEDPHGLGYLADRALDKLHIARDLAHHAREVQSNKVNRYYQQGNDQVAATVQATPVNPILQKVGEAEQAGATPEQVGELRREQINPLAAKEKPDLKLYRLPNGETQYYDAADPQSHPPGAQAVVPGSSSTKPEVEPLEKAGVPYGVKTPDGKVYLASQMNDPKTPPEVKETWNVLSKALKDKTDAEEKKRQEEWAELENRQQKSLAAANQRAIYTFQNMLSMNAVRPAQAMIAKQQQQYYGAKDLQSKMQSLMPAALGGNQQAQVAILADHIAMTTHQPGAAMRPTKALFDEAAASQPWLEKITKNFDQDGVLSGVVLSPEQIQNMVSLAPVVTASELDTLQQMQASFGDVLNPTPAQEVPRTPVTPKAKLLRSGKRVSVRQAMSMPQNKGKTEAQVRADIQAHHYLAVP